MANVKFAYGTTVPTTSTSGFTDGCIYFNTAYKTIHLRQGSNVYTFDTYGCHGYESAYDSGIAIARPYQGCDGDDIYIPKAAQTQFGVAKIYVSGTTCYIVTT